MKKGRLKVSKTIFEHEIKHQYLKSIFENFIPIIIQEDFDCRIYLGYSDLFEELEEGEEIPFYDAIIVTRTDGSSVLTEFKRYK